MFVRTGTQEKKARSMNLYSFSYSSRYLTVCIAVTGASYSKVRLMQRVSISEVDSPEIKKEDKDLEITLWIRNNFQ